ncbi:Trm112 family protein [Candidatus Ishikawella capsulata]|uniref:UPF0434 protein ICMP_591 n=1 Tax=Candidatus Ishikawaella capsulata Mpkobe TaxID=476281 RepID=C5WDM0_9ENTR|nr:Trm112 family protein [Candidatus Ishikawaella capsulata]BAH83426.1 hypothetical protein ICMP_591 [Candidatus Ishikawaella capsulata Mpkobe]
MDCSFLKILACPKCNNELHYNHITHELICKVDRLAFPIKDGIPLLLEKEAKQFNE